MKPILPLLLLSVMLGFFGCDQRSNLEKNIQGSSLYEYQWYLHNTGQSAGADRSGSTGEDINLSDVWDTYRGTGVAIAIVDTGIESRHYDLSDNLDLTLSARYYDGKIDFDKNGLSDPSPINEQLSDPDYKDIDMDNAHGTMCAGIAAAVDDNEIGVIGVAPQATLVGRNAFADTTYFQVESFADALYNPDLPVDVSSNSWNDGVGNITEESPEYLAIQDGVTEGRNGKGVIYCFAAGNERYSHHNSNWHRELNNPYVIAVASLDADGIYSSYSNTGANILISGFGGEFGYTYPAIVTTDLLGDLGLDREQHFDVVGNENGDFTNLMNGTSAAAPMIAGVAALLLDANPNLSYRDIRYILATTARKNDPDDYTSDWVQNGAGYWVNHSYGFGAVNVATAVEKAKNFAGLENNISFSIASDDLNITFDTTTAYTHELNTTVDMLIEYVEVELELAHNYPEDLTITLTSPDETNSTLTKATGFSGSLNETLYPDFFNGFTLGSVRCLDEHSKGSWRLTFTDKNKNSYASSSRPDSGTLYRYKLIFHGREP